MQWDSRWGYEEYGSSVIGITGCGPTCLSMVVIGLVGDTDATPKSIADFATENGYYVVGTGTKWSLMTAVADEYNLTCTQLKNNEENVCHIKLFKVTEMFLLELNQNISFVLKSNQLQGTLVYVYTYTFFSLSCFICYIYDYTWRYT